MENKTLIGLTEIVEINGKKHKARIDTGAKRSSIDRRLAYRLGLGPVIKTTKVRSVHGQSIRPIIRAIVRIRDRNLKATFNIADRKDMSYSILIGRNILKHGFLIDTSKK